FRGLQQVGVDRQAAGLADLGPLRAVECAAVAVQEGAQPPALLQLLTEGVLAEVELGGFGGITDRAGRGVGFTAEGPQEGQRGSGITAPHFFLVFFWGDDGCRAGYREQLRSLCCLFSGGLSPTIGAVSCPGRA